MSSAAFFDCGSPFSLSPGYHGVNMENKPRLVACLRECALIKKGIIIYFNFLEWYSIIIIETDIQFKSKVSFRHLFRSTPCPRTKDICLNLSI